MSTPVSEVASAAGRPSAAERVAELMRGIEPHTASSLLSGSLAESDREELVKLLVEEEEAE